MNKVTLKGTPYPYQLEAINFHKEKKWSLNLYSMGLGKSLIALALCEGCTNVLIICPAFLKFNWEEEIKKWVSGGCFYISSYESVTKIPDHPWEAIICDEIHYLKNKDAIRTKRVYQILHTYKPKYFLGLTGTPIKNRVTDFWTLFKFVIPDFKFNYWAFCERYSNRLSMEIGGRTITKYTGLKAANAKELSDLVRTCAVRKKASDVLDLPSQIWKDVILTENFDLLLKSQFDLYLAENSIEKNMASYKLVNAKEKTKYTISFAQEFIDQRLPTIIFTDHVSACEEIAAYFKVNPIHGQSKVPRGEIVDRFNQGKDLVIVATIPSLNVGVNLTTARHMIFNDFSYTPSEMDQAEKRIHRIGQTGTCFYYYIFSSKLDKYIYDMLKTKREVSNAIIG